MLALTLNGQTLHLPEANLDAAMRQCWEAQQAGDATAHLVRIDPANSSPTGDDDPDPPPCAPGAVSAIAHERIERQGAWLTKAGFALEPPLYAPGTRVLPVGDRNFRIERQRVESLPVFPDAASHVTRVIAREQRADTPVSLHDLHLSDRGTLRVQEQELGLEVDAFQQLAILGGFGIGARYLSECCPAPLRATNVNAQFQRAPNRSILLRTRAADADTRQVFAAVTPTYTPVDTDLVLGTVGSALADAHTEMVYDGTGIAATALWMPDQVVDLAAGDIFKAGVRISTDDTGRGRVRITAVVFRNRCLNLLIIGEGTIETVAAVHKGDAAAILDRVRLGVGAAREKIAEFLVAWGHARTVMVDAEQLIRDWVEHKKLAPIPAKERDATVEAILAAWHKEPGNTLADTVNAVSRAAHEHPLWGMDFRAELERRAAQLVYAYA